MSMSPLFWGVQCGQTTANVIQSGLSSQEDSHSSPDLVVTLSLVQSGISWLPIFQKCLLGHVPLGVHQDPQDLYWNAAFHPNTI